MGGAHHYPFFSPTDDPPHQPPIHDDASTTTTGNGTEEILTAQRASSFQFISLHAANIFPHTGAADPGRHPHVVNIPIEAPLTPAKYRRAWAQVDAAVDAFAPDLILLSAGYDAHVNDPIGARGECVCPYWSPGVR